MANKNADFEMKQYEVGFGKPPRNTQFRKGTTGNPRGRPKGAKSLHSILVKMGREPVKVNINGRIRSVSRLEAIVMQLSNKAASGDLKAIRELLAAHRLFPEPTEPVEAEVVSTERDEAVLKSILSRMRNSDPASGSESGKEE